MLNIFKIWGETWRNFRKYKGLALPFVLLAVFEGILLTFLALAPQRPFFSLLGPPIRAIYGDQFLKYPEHLILLSQVFNAFNIWLGAILGTLMSSVAIGMMAEAFLQKRPSFAKNTLYALRRCIPLWTLWLMVWALLKILRNYLEPTLLNQLPDVLLVKYAAIIIIHLIPQLLLVFAIPLIMIDRLGFFKSLKLNFVILFRNLPAAALLFFVPMICLLPVIHLGMNPSKLVAAFDPEAMLVVLGVQIISTQIVNTVIILSIATLFMKKRPS